MVKKKRSKKIGSIFYMVVMSFVAIAIVGGLKMAIDKGNVFHVTAVVQSSQTLLAPGKAVSFWIDNQNNLLDKNAKFEYTVRVFGNPVKDFKFKNLDDGEEYSFCSLDFTDSFVIKKQNDKFSISTLESGLVEIIKTALCGATVDIPYAYYYKSEYFLIEVASRDRSCIKQIPFRFTTNIDNIELNKSEVIFQ